MNMPSLPIRLAILLAAVCLSRPGRAAEAPLRCLADAPEKPRFELTDRTWPAQPGEAAICLWAGDKLAALSITIDDNIAPDHDWWSEQGQKYGWHFTWFVITERVGAGNAFFGTWDGFARLRALGHDVQSHTRTHLHDDAMSIADEYRLPVADIENNLKDTKVLTLAYPGGAKSARNDRKVAAQYYIAARGGRGFPNAANQIDYLQTSSVSGMCVDTPKTPWADLKNVLDPKSRSYRGWYCTHYHGVKPETREGVLKNFDFVKAHENDIWVGLFREVVLYGQERDTATLRSLGSGDDGIRLNLEDRMDDSLFAYPLTLKVRLPDAWTGVGATQNGRAVPAVRIVHEGAPFALVQAVPDRGEIVLRAAAE